MNKITIAIDGYSSCGKSTVARELAKMLGYTYVDSGAMYRAITLNFIRKKFTLWNQPDAVKQVLNESEIEFEINQKNGFSEVCLNGENVEQEIRSMEVSNVVSKISAIPEVRKKLVSLQRELGKNKGVVMDGRDIGTVVFPAAELKIFMTANPDVRARRRFDELKEKGTDVSLEEIKKNIEQRDYEDTNRKDSPLQKAEDAVILDNSFITRQQQLEVVIDLVRKLEN